MIIKNKYQFAIFFFLAFIGGIIYFLILDQIMKILDVFMDYTIYVLMILYFAFIYTFLIKKKWYIFTVYLISLLVLMFSRNSKSGINLDFYLLEWLKMIFKNKIIALNVIGNIIILIPFGFYIKKHIYIGIIIIVLLEWLQMLTSRGLFDIVDIVLNSIGLLCGWLGAEAWKSLKKKKLMKMKKKK